MSSYPERNPMPSPRRGADTATVVAAVLALVVAAAAVVVLVLMRRGGGEDRAVATAPGGSTSASASPGGSAAPSASAPASTSPPPASTSAPPASGSPGGGEVEWPDATLQLPALLLRSGGTQRSPCLAGPAAFRDGTARVGRSTYELVPRRGGPATGDVTGDGTPETALRIVCRGSGAVPEDDVEAIYVVDTSSGRPRVLGIAASEAPADSRGDSGVITAYRILDGAVDTTFTAGPFTRGVLARWDGSAFTVRSVPRSPGN